MILLLQRRCELIGALPRLLTLHRWWQQRHEAQEADDAAVLVRRQRMCRRPARPTKDPPVGQQPIRLYSILCLTKGCNPNPQATPSSFDLQSPANSIPALPLLDQMPLALASSIPWCIPRLPGGHLRPAIAPIYSVPKSQLTYTSKPQLLI